MRFAVQVFHGYSAHRFPSDTSFLGVYFLSGNFGSSPNLLMDEVAVAGHVELSAFCWTPICRAVLDKKLEKL